MKYNGDCEIRIQKAVVKQDQTVLNDSFLPVRYVLKVLNC